MFTIFCDTNESVYDLIQPPEQIPPPGPPLYRSRYSCKVREDAYCAKSGCFRTMGVPKVCQCPPEHYLKKQSRVPISICAPAVPKVEMTCDPCQTEDDGCQQNRSQNPCDNTSSMGAECGSGPCDEDPCPPPCHPQDVMVCKKAKCPCPDAPLVFECTKPNCRIARICYCCGINPKPPVPSPCTTFGIVPTCAKDFIRENIRRAVRSVPRKPARRFVDDRVGNVKDWDTSGMPRLYVYGENFGKIPCYIDDIKKELYVKDQTAKYKMMEKDREMQQQIRHLDPTERDAILCGLKKNWEEVFREYQSLPLLIDTPGMVTRKSDYEKKLKALELDIQLVDRHDHVFVADTCKSFYLA